MLAFDQNLEHSIIMRFAKIWFMMLCSCSLTVWSAENPPAFPSDPDQALERTCFQTTSPWSSAGNLRSDVAIVYGIDPGLPQRIKTWRDRGYRIHLMTGV
jgi:hypothetical protein